MLNSTQLLSAFSSRSKCSKRTRCCSSGGTAAIAVAVPVAAMPVFSPSLSLVICYANTEKLLCYLLLNRENLTGKEIAKSLVALQSAV